MSEFELIEMLHKASDTLKTEYNMKKGYLEDDRDNYNYYSGMIDGINNLLLQFYHNLWETRSDRLN